MEFVIWDKGKPIATTPREAERIKKRLRIIDKVLKEFGYKEGMKRYNEIVTEMAQKDFSKYVKFLDRVQELAKKKGC